MLLNALCLTSPNKEIASDVIPVSQETIEQFDQNTSNEANENTEKDDDQVSALRRTDVLLVLCMGLFGWWFSGKSFDYYGPIAKYLLSFHTRPHPDFPAWELDMQIFHGGKLFKSESGFYYELDQDKEFILHNDVKIELDKEKLCSLFGRKLKDSYFGKNSLCALSYIIFSCFSSYSMRLFYLGLPKPSDGELINPYGVENLLFDIYSCVNQNLEDFGKRAEIVKFVGLFYWCNKDKVEKHDFSYKLNKKQF